VRSGVRILGIESSCDETAAAVVETGGGFCRVWWHRRLIFTGVWGSGAGAGFAGASAADCAGGARGDGRSGIEI